MTQEKIAEKRSKQTIPFIFLRFWKVVAPISFIAIYIAILIVLVPFIETMDPASIVLIILAALASSLAISGIYIFEWRKLANILYKDCRPDLLIPQTYKIRQARWSHPQTKHGVAILEFLALYHLEKLDMAEALLLQNLKYRMVKRSVRAESGIYIYYLMILNLKKGNIEEAEANLQAMHTIKNEYRGKRAISIIGQYIELATCALAFYKKEYEKCRPFYQAGYKNPKSPLMNRAVSSHHLGVIALAENDNSKAAECLNYAISNGGTLGVVGHAKQLLASIQTKKKTAL